MAPPIPVAKPWNCRKCDALQQPGTDRCAACNATRRPTGGERRKAAQEEARREAAKRGELWSAVTSPPCAEGVAAVVEWLNVCNVAITRAVEADFPDDGKIRLLQGVMKALVRAKAAGNAPHRESVLRLRERHDGTPYLQAVLGDDPPSDLQALPMWHFNRLAHLLHSIAQTPEIDDAAARKFRALSESHQAGIYARETETTEALQRETGAKDVRAAVTKEELVWPVIASEHRPAPEGAAVLFSANPGPQSRFVESDTDEILYGGRTGGGKSAGLLIAALQHLMAYPHPQNNALIVRNTWAEVPRQPFFLMSVTGLGRLQARGYPVQWHGDTHCWDLGPYGKLWFGYLDSLAAANRYQGGEFSFFGVDEATLIPPEPVEIIAAERMRTRPGTPARVRLTANPGGPYHSHYLRSYAPWLDRRASYMEAAAAGVVPLAEPGEVLYYVIDPATGRERWCSADEPGARSRTYIPAGVADTPQYDVEQYLVNMEKIRDPLRKAQMMLGDWSAEHSQGKVFRRGWFRQVAELPRRARRYVRSWDMAWGVSDSACWTVGVLLGELEGGGWAVLDVLRLRGSEGTTRPVIRAVADADRAIYGAVTVRLPADMGLAGMVLRDSFVRELSGHDVVMVPDKGDKIERVRPLAAQAEYGHVYILQGSHPSREIAADLVRRGIECSTGYQWVDGFLSELESIDPEKPKVGYKDQMDAFNGAFEYLESSQTRGLPAPSAVRGAGAKLGATFGFGRGGGGARGSLRAL